MNTISAKYIYLPDGSYLEDGAVVFDDHIIDVGKQEHICKKYNNILHIKTAPNTILYPGFINTHVHLEFGANRNRLRYGEFMRWLESVIQNRDELLELCSEEVMQKEIYDMLSSGISTFGAVSNFATELEVCKRAPQRVIFFNELIGSNPVTVDLLYGDFLERVELSKAANKDAKIIPAVAIHSPYSLHPLLVQKAVALAKSQNMPLSAHLLESRAEREWLEDGRGEFKEFFKTHFNASRPLTGIFEFISSFDNYPTMFVHATEANEHELSHLAKRDHHIAHCPRSNRYLGCKRLKIESLKLPFSVATDGLSSNDSLNIFDEMRAALMLHNDIDLQKLSKMLIKAVTSDAADALKIDAGRIEVGRVADFAILDLKQEPAGADDLALWSILHTKSVDMLFIGGKRYI